MHKYFVVYIAVLETMKTITGNTQINRDEPIYSVDHIRNVEKSILSNHNTVTVAGSDKVIPKMLQCTITFYKAF